MFTKNENGQVFDPTNRLLGRGGIAERPPLRLPFCHAAIKAKKPKDARYPPRITTIGERLRAKRLDIGLDQKDVAIRLGVSEDSVCYWGEQSSEALAKDAESDPNVSVP